MDPPVIATTGGARSGDHSGAISCEHTHQAYGTLLGQLGVGYADSIVYATTNYDVVSEYVIERLGGMPDWGEQRTLIASGEAPLRVDRLLDGMPRYVPVLHLHGRIGWYRKEGGESYSGNVSRHLEGYGVPIVMLPDPEKVYNTDSVISALWSQFEEALQRARRVLVLGHSLNDRALVEALQRNVTPPERVAVTVLADSDQPTHLADEAAPAFQILSSELPAAAIVPIRFAQNAVDGCVSSLV